MFILIQTAWETQYSCESSVVNITSVVPLENIVMIRADYQQGMESV